MLKQACWWTACQNEPLFKEIYFTLSHFHLCDMWDLSTHPSQ